jgi:integral membrane protein (TIGR00529 family)
MFSWIGFILSLLIVLFVARKNLPLALISGAIVLGLFTLQPLTVLEKIGVTLIDPSILLLALAMGIIPMMGGIMKANGQMDDLVNNMRIGRRGLMALTPAIMGLLPMPGGALLSAPVLEKGGKGVPADLKVAINNWFRHLFVMIYPLSSALIASAKISALNVYAAAVYLLPTFFVALIIGCIFFLRPVQGNIEYEKDFSWKQLLLPIGIILSAPFLDFTLKMLFALPYEEIATCAGVSVACGLTIAASRKKLNFREITRKMKPWNFSLIIIGMFIFLHVFQSSDVAGLIAGIPLPPVTLCVIAGFILGFATGRVLLPASIILPVYMTTAAISPLVFAIIYTSIFFGYVISPVHPCVGVSLQYFDVPLGKFLKLLFVPTIIIFIITFVMSLIIS